MKKTIRITIPLFVISLIGSSATSVIINPNNIFKVDNEIYTVNQTMNFNRIELTIRETPGWIKFNNTGFHMTSRFPINITLESIPSDIVNASLNEKVLAFYADTYTDSITFSISGFHSDNIYKINKEGETIIETDASTSGYLEFNNDIWDNEYFEIFYLEEAALKNYYPNNESTKNQRPPANISINVNKTNYDIYIYYLYRTAWPNSVQLLASALNQDINSFIVPSLSDWDNEFIWGDTPYCWWVNVYDGQSWINKSYWYKTKGNRCDVTNSGDVTSGDISIVWLNRYGLAPYDGIYDVISTGDITSSDVSYVWMNRT